MNHYDSEKWWEKKLTLYISARRSFPVQIDMGSERIHQCQEYTSKSFFSVFFFQASLVCQCQSIACLVTLSTRQAEWNLMEQVR